MRHHSTALEKVDDEHYRALVIKKAQLPHPENQSGSKRLIVESMASVGINADVTDIVYTKSSEVPSAANRSTALFPSMMQSGRTATRNTRRRDVGLPCRRAIRTAHPTT